MRSAQDIITDVVAASRITRDPRLLALLEEIKAYLETPPPSPSASLPRQAGPTSKSDSKIKKTIYQRQYMADYRKGIRRTKKETTDEIPADPSCNDFGSDPGLG